MDLNAVRLQQEFGLTFNEGFRYGRFTALREAADVDMIKTAIDAVHDMDVTHRDYAKSVARAILALGERT